MRFLRRRVAEPQDPTSRLWHELGAWFRDDSSHAGPDLSFSDLTPTDLERGWQFLAARADPIDPAKTVWDSVNDCEVSAAEVLKDGAFAAATRCSNLLMGLSNVKSGSVRLPWLGVMLWPTELALYWWVGKDEWNAETLAGFAVLLADLRTLLPNSPVSLEWDSDDDFWPAIDAYLSALGSA